MSVDRSHVERLTRELLEAIGEDPDRPGLTQTPGRMAELYAEFFAGVGEDPAVHLARTISVSRGPAPDTLPSGAVLLRDIRFRSVCEHHLLPFVGVAHIGYLPGDRILGLSKFARMVEFHARRPQTQERVTKRIADHLQQLLEPRGVGVVIEAEHTCMTLRGARAPGTRTTTSALFGRLRTDPRSRAEFLDLTRSTP